MDNTIGKSITNILLKEEKISKGEDRIKEITSTR